MPSCGSVAEPLKSTGSPTAQVKAPVGASMTADGGVLPAVMRTVSVLVASRASVTLSVTVYVPGVVYVNVGRATAESPNAPSPSRSQL